MYHFAAPVEKLIEELKKIPGIGRKSAQRIAFFLLRNEKKTVFDLAEAIIKAREETFLCSQCNNITSQEPCKICSDLKRERTRICIVEEPFNIFSIERTSQYHGLYHVLHGNLSPIRGIGPQELKLYNLDPRIESENIEEIIIATSPTTEGNATAHYIYESYKHYGIKITRIALGLPIGADIDYVDSVTISRAFKDRSEI